MFVIKYKKIFFLISAITILASVFSIFYFGLNFGIDFRGGSLLEVSFIGPTPEAGELQAALRSQNLGEFSLRASDHGSFILRTSSLDENGKEILLETMSLGGRFEVVEERFNFVGPIIGEELKKKAWIAIGLSLVAIVLFIAFAFRKVSSSNTPNSGSASSWIYSLAAILALAHDIIIPVGVFSFLGILIGAEIDALFVMALLAILGYSINDTIIVFDRVRENLRNNQEYGKKETFDQTVGLSLNQTFTRSINTSLTTLLVLSALYILGDEITRNFTLVLIVGIIAGTYSSIFLASPLLVVLGKKASQ